MRQRDELGNDRKATVIKNIIILHCRYQRAGNDSCNSLQHDELENNDQGKKRWELSVHAKKLSR